MERRSRFLPARIILDVGDAIRDFHEETAKMNDYEYCIDEILDLILGYIRIYQFAESGLQQLLVDINLCYGNDAEYLCTAAQTLGKVILEQVKLIGLYDEEGCLLYEFSTAWCDLYTPILQKRLAMEKIHHTRGLMPNGEIQDNGVTPEDLESHIEYNKFYRKERALFVDGKCVYRGFVSIDVCNQMEKELQNHPVVLTAASEQYN